MARIEKLEKLCNSFAAPINSDEPLSAWQTNSMWNKNKLFSDAVKQNVDDINNNN